MIGIGLIILWVGLLIGLTILVVQTVAVLGYDCMAKWTDPLPTLTGMGVVVLIGILTIMTGILQHTL
jgi:hypothetical protein